MSKVYSERATEKPVTVLGIFVNDMTFVADRLARPGETVLGHELRTGPGGKGCNQAVAARRAGARVNFITCVGDDKFGQIAHHLFRREEINAQHVKVIKNEATGVAGIHLDAGGQNAIIVAPAAASKLSKADIDAARTMIAESAVLLTQLELPLAIVRHALEVAKKSDTTTILNPAPATSLPHDIFPLIDVFSPNETEAATLWGHPVDSIEQAAEAGKYFIERGVRNVIVTLGSKGAILCARDHTVHIDSLSAGPVYETTGAGDAFNGALAAALSEGLEPLPATVFANAAAAISVTRKGTTPAMPRRQDIDDFLKDNT